MGSTQKFSKDLRTTSYKECKTVMRGCSKLNCLCAIAGLFAVATQSACTSLPNAPYIKPPDLMDQIANADLSAPKPHVPQDQGVEYASGDWQHSPYELYPSDDSRDDSRVMPRSNFKGVAKRDNGYELNFDNAELSLVAKVILKDTLKISYVLDPSVRGTVTLSTGGPITRSELLHVLESILAMNNASLIIDGDVYQIVREKIAGNTVSVSIDYATEKKQIGAGYGVSIFPIRFVSASSLLETLRSFVKKPDVLRADVLNNLLIIRGTGRTRQQLLEIASMFDVDWMRGQSAGIYTLSNVLPSQMIGELQKVFEEDGRGKGLVRFQPIDRLNAVLVIARKSYLLEDAEVWVRRLDRQNSEGVNYHVYLVEHGKAKDVAAVLNAMFGGGGVPSPEEEVAPDQRATTLVSGAQAPSGDEQGAETQSIAEPAQVTTTGAIRIVPDEINNKLLIQANGRDYRRILSLLQSIDRPPLQVLINATLAEVTLNDNLSYGVQVFLQTHDKQNTYGFSNGQTIEIGPNLPGLNFLWGSFLRPKVILDALATETAVKVVSSPSAVVINNETATLTVGDEIPIVSRQVQDVTNVLAPTINEIEYRKTGVTLKVTPRINSNGMVTMEIDQEISVVVASTSAAGDLLNNLTPTISQRQIISTVAVQDGQMVVLAGLINEQSERAQGSVPLLNQIPYLGDIIGSNVREKKRTELIIFLQPTVIRNPEDARSVSEEMRAKLQALAPRPAPWDMEVSGASGEEIEVREFK